MKILLGIIIGVVLVIGISCYAAIKELISQIRNN
ncbi:hypothetical protein LCGC14_1754370 [marine sediment metagenome]|uniref:Uncharacterized protein n=1 Tax=marine sediment metagenome TaxID=412755 RepID=A0A0F9HQA3_9ZZZZ